MGSRVLARGWFRLLRVGRGTPDTMAGENGNDAGYIVLLPASGWLVFGPKR